MPSSVASLIPVKFHEQSLKCRYFNFLLLPNSAWFFCWIVNFSIRKNDIKNKTQNQNQIKIKIKTHLC